jgi:phosphonate transport system substrate-binding protein
VERRADAPLRDEPKAVPVEGFVRRLCVLLLLLALAPGCAGNKTEEPPPAKRTEHTSLRIGLIPEQNIFKQLQRYQLLARYLSRKTGAGIELKILSRYGNIIDNFRSSKLDGAFFGSFTYAMAHRKLGVKVLARPVAPDNVSTYYGLIFVRQDSGIRGLADMKGKRFVFVDKATTAGYLLPIEYFHEGGVGDYRHYFRETYYSGTHEGAVTDVLDGRADAGATKNTVFERMARQNPRIRKELAVLAVSPPVPENGLAVRGDLDPALTEKLKDALLRMHMDPEGARTLAQFGATRFIETREEEYDPVYRYAGKVHLDLSTYDYKND